MTPPVPGLRSRKASAPKRASVASERRKLAAEQAAVVIPRWLSGWRGELILLALVLLGIAIFITGYGVGMRDDTFHTHWFSPLRGTRAAPLAVGNVQGGVIDRSGNMPLLLTVRGLRILPSDETYALSVVRSGQAPVRCAFFGVGTGTTQVHLSCPNLPTEPSDWLITAASEKAGQPERALLRSARR